MSALYKTAEVFIATPEPVDSIPVGASTREGILAAAHELLLAVGIRRTSVEEVARRAGVSRGTVYLYFSDKNALVLAVLLRNGVVVRDMLAAQLKRARSLREQLTTAARFSVSPQRGELLITLREREPETLALMLLTDSQRWVEQSARFWAPRLRAAAKNGELPPDTDIEAAAEWVARTLYTASVVPSNRVDPATRSPKQIGAYLSRFLLAGLAGR